MTQAYSDKTREAEPFALPDVEVFYARPVVIGCGECGNTTAPWNGEYDNQSLECPICGDTALTGRFAQSSTGRWWWWSCFPGCLPDSEPSGPFDTEAEALADAQDIN
jgi:ribosomal protein S27E